MPGTVSARETAAGTVAVASSPGGDIACAVAAPQAVRLLVGDVMGHDGRAAQVADQVARAFLGLAAAPGPLPAVAARLHDYVARHTRGEEFVTAQLISVPDDAEGEAEIVCLGHPAPLLLRDGRVTPLEVGPPSPPLGLVDLGGAAPRAARLGARPGDTVLLYTDGVSEARGERGQPFPLAERAAALGARTRVGEHAARLPALITEDLLEHVGGRLRDDATLACLRFPEAGAVPAPGSARAAGIDGRRPAARPRPGRQKTSKYSRISQSVTSSSEPSAPASARDAW